ncbi:SGNH/GDSL hydrolase family protein [Kitasatospora sp. NPDC048239]|uniref:SGNH/GDSL hydrolase family protein n=1 Tax=Kitasatospora sp. NPDC048239 TaxID=3364046 RepID=UPI003720AD04
MQRHRLLAALAATPLLALTAAGPARAVDTSALDAPPRYAALGDSYAAGTGAGAYEQDGGDCHRSANAYPALWAADHGATAFLAAACSGATTADVRRDQLPRVAADTGLVTLTAGGNDLGFAQAAGDCLQPLTTESRCDRTLDEAERRLREELPDRLAELYDGVRTAAPAARVVVTGYPHLLRTGTTCLIGTDPRRQRFNALTDELDELIRRQAGTFGFGFADVRTAFEGHEVCAPAGREWITGIVLPRLWESFHPTADGQSLGYLPAVTAAAGPR